MKRRPWVIVVLAVLHVLTPTINLLFHSALLGISPVEFLLGLRSASFLEIYRVYLLMPVAGIAIFAMKRWSYPVFLASWAGCMAANYTSLRAILTSQGHGNLLPAGRETCSILLNLALIAYFFLPRVRSAYFLPGIRWWEHKPRYLMKGVAGVIRWEERTFSGALENLSLTGFKWKPDAVNGSTLAPGDCIRIAFEVFGGKYQFNGQVIRVDASGALGVQLLHTVRSRFELGMLIRKFRASRFQLQSYCVSVAEDYRDFVSWVKTWNEGPKSLLPYTKK